jgi:hypothetical protein
MCRLGSDIDQNICSLLDIDMALAWNDTIDLTSFDELEKYEFIDGYLKQQLTEALRKKVAKNKEIDKTVKGASEQ